MNNEIIDKNTYEIKGVEIFASGNWNGDSYSDSDINTIIDAFNKTKNKLKPYLKLGHGNSQKLLKEDELPAAGWISNLYKVGNKLVADFVDIPKKIYELIVKKAYRRVSAEIYVNIPIDNEKYPYALKAVSLLGGETPAVHTLNDILNLYGMNSNLALQYSNNSEIEIRNIEFNYKEENIMENTLEVIEQENNKLKTDLENFKNENETLKVKISEFEKTISEFKDNTNKLQVELNNIQLEKKKNEIESKLEKFVLDKKIVPAQKDILREILLNTNSDKKFTVNNTEYDSESLINAFVDANITEVLPTKPESEDGKKEVSMDDKVKEFMAKNKVSYKEALLKIAAENK